MNSGIHRHLVLSESHAIDLEILEQELDHGLRRLHPRSHQDRVRVHVVTPERMPEGVLESLTEVLPNYYGDVEDSLADAIDVYLLNEEKRLRASDRGIAFSDTRDWGIVFKEYEDLYELAAPRILKNSSDFYRRVNGSTTSSKQRQQNL